MKSSLPIVAAFCGAFAVSLFPASATDYYVNKTNGNDGYDGLAASSAFATIDKAISSAAAGDTIYVAGGTYSTTTQWGPNLLAKLVGTGASRNDVVIESAGSYRTLRMAANSWLENVTVVGCTDISKADKGGAIEMSGGTVTNCVIRDGTAYGNSDNKNAGGNLYVNSGAALVVDCAISGGTAKNRGGNVCLDRGTLRNCTIAGGSTSGGSENNGGNVWTYQGRIENCAISGGSAVLGGNVFIYNANAVLTGGTISNGTATQYGGNVYLREGSMVNAAVSGGATTTTSDNYGGGNVYATGNAIVSNCVILAGSAYRRGGNVYAIGGATVADCAITNGVCSANIGGNIYMEAATVTNSTVYGGSAPAGRGGNIFLNNAASLVTDCTIENGTAGTQGGNLYVNAGAVSGSTVANGTATQQGGNVFMAASTVVSDCVISNGIINSTNSNWDGPKGVNVNLNGASAKLLRCHVIGGTTTPLKEDQSFYYDRGSVAVNNASAIIDNCLVEGCACGGVVMQSNGYLYNSTVVNNGRYGYWAWNANQHVYNTVIYGNTGNDANTDYTGNMPNGESAAFLNNALTKSGSRHTTDAYPTVVLLADDSAFTDYANGDYSPASGSALIDAGATDPRGAAASATDLGGNPRLISTIDIGCYEFQKPDMSVHIDSAVLDQASAPAIVTFTHSADNSADPATLVFAYDFGDGSTASNIADGTVTHTYTTPGAYTVTITATSGCEEERAEMSYPGYVRVASPTVYVTPGTGSGTFPYNTPETGFGSLRTAVGESIAGNTLLLGAGTYETGNEIVVDKAITILGTGTTPEAVVVRNTNASQGHRTMAVSHAGAFVSNLTIENGCNNIGANLHLEAGVVSNCVIRSGIAAANGGNASGSGVELASAGTLTHCIVSNNVVQGTSSDGGMTGGAIYIPYNSKNGRISNCLIAHNRYITSGETVKAGTAGIRFFGSNDNTQIENNTIVANTVEGTLSDDSAGIYCTSWNVRFRNNIIVGNYETGKEKVTATKINEHCTNVNGLTDADVPATSLFKDFAGGNFSLKPGSPAYNKGTTSGLALLPAIDLAGNPRVQFTKIDIGCYECQSKPCTVVFLR